MTTGITTKDIKTLSVNVSSDLSSLQYKFVKLGAGKIVSATANATAAPFVLLEGNNGATTSTTDTIALSGVTKITLGGSVTAGDKLTATTGGVAITTTTDTDNYGGIALESGVSGDVIEIIVTQGMIAG